MSPEIPTSNAPETGRAVPRFGELLLARMARNSRSSLADVCDPEGSFSEPETELTEHLIRHRREVASWIHAVLRSPPGGLLTWGRSPERFLRGRLVPWLQRKNQFLCIDDAASLELDGLYRCSLLETAHVLSSPSEEEEEVVDGLRNVLGAHQEGIASFVRSRLGPRLRDTVCAEYSPSLQLGVLGLSSRTLLEPVLDVGCGANAALVRFLLAEGLVAYGIDRDAPDDVAIVADWLTFPYGAGHWGTVVSHLGFSLHFLHHHLGHGPTTLIYAKAYMGILRSLRVGGTFAYAPGLPFIEALLPASVYRLERIPLPRGPGTPVLLAAQEATGLALGQATHIRRLA